MSHTTAHCFGITGTSGAAPFRQLWIDGRRAPRAVLSGGAYGLAPAAGGYTTNASVGAEMAHAELRWPSQVLNWIEPRCAVAAAANRSLAVRAALRGQARTCNCIYRIYFADLSLSLCVYV